MKRLCGRPRAIYDDEKDSRRQDILNAAARLFARAEYQAISVKQICDEVGLSKGTFYLYYKTKEAVYLALHTRLIDGWGADLKARIKTLPAGASATELCRALITAFRRDPQLLRLLPLLHSILEVNVSVEDILAYKKQLFAHQTQQTDEVHRILPQLSPEAVGLFLVTAHMTLISTWQLANPPPNVRKALKDGGLKKWIFDFDTLAEVQLVTFLKGLTC